MVKRSANKGVSYSNKYIYIYIYIYIYENMGMRRNITVTTRLISGLWYFRSHYRLEK